MNLGKAIVILILAFIIIALSLMQGHNNGYKQGQIDALNGKVKYHKVLHKDSTITWELKNK